MNIFSNITSATRAALGYITVGAIMIVWSAIYYVYLQNHPPAQGTDAPWYWCTGFLLTGGTLLIIGLGVGWIGRSARQAEQPHAVIPTPIASGQVAPTVVPLANMPVTPTGGVPINPAGVQPLVPPTVPVQTPTQPIPRP
jgi:hypothetical protein